MKLHFEKDDSIYKIFKTVRKIPSYRSVQIFVDPQHDFFATSRRGQEVLETLEKKGVTVTFIVNDLKSKRYFEDLGANVEFQKPHPLFKLGRQIYNLIFATKEFHNNLLIKQNYISYLVLVAELTVIGGVLYLFRGMISPNATIQIKPAYTLESIVYNYRYYPQGDNQVYRDDSFISLPYYTGTVTFTHSMTMDVTNITYKTTPAQGQVKIFNTLPESISLLVNSKLITDTGILFTTDERVNIPPAVGDQPGEVVVSATAMEYGESQQIIGEEGNIPVDTVLYIRNLPSSYETQEIYVQAMEDFEGGTTASHGVVSSNDIATIRNKITDYMYEKRKEVLQEHFSDTKFRVLLFDDLIEFQVNNFSTTALPGENAALIEGTAEGAVLFKYIERNDLLGAVDTYLQQRPSENLSLYDIDNNSLRFYDYTYVDQGRYYLIPTKVNAIRGYNFMNDTNNVIAELKEKISGLSLAESKKILLEYEQIAEAEIKVSPPWYESLPQLPSRIEITTPYRQN